MPRYVYQCVECDETFQVTHSMSERLTVCTECGVECQGNGSLKRLPSTANNSLSKTKEQTSKQRVDEFIKTARAELAEQAEESRKDYEH